MLMYPEVQRRIQKELDDAIGRGNTPNMAGVQSCRLLQAAWKESLRFTPPVPAGALIHFASPTELA
jgi:cytochrome P450